MITITKTKNPIDKKKDILINSPSKDIFKSNILKTARYFQNCSLKNTSKLISQQRHSQI